MKTRDAVRQAKAEAKEYAGRLGSAEQLRAAAREMLAEGDKERDTVYGYIFTDDGFGVAARDYIGTATGMDPCGRYHHMLSPNGLTKACEAYWETLEAELEKLGCGLESGEGDPIDQFVTRFVGDISDLEDDDGAEVVSRR